MEQNNIQETPAIIIKIFAAAACCIGIAALTGWILEIPTLTTFGTGLIPMAPSTALLFVLLGISVVLRSFFPQNVTVHNIVITLSAISILSAFTLLVTSYFGLHFKIEQIGIPVDMAFSGTLAGHMSPITAFCFILAGLSNLITLISTSKPRYRLIAIWLTLLLLVITLILLIAYLFGTPVLYGSNLIPPALSTSIAFACLGTVLLTLTTFQYVSYSKVTGALNTRSSYMLILVFGLLSFGIIASGFFYLKYFQKYYKTGVEHQLSTIVELRAEKLRLWKNERLGDAGLIYKNNSFYKLVRRYFDMPADLKNYADLKNWVNKLRNGYRYNRVFILDTRQAVRLSEPNHTEQLSQIIKQNAIKSLSSGKITFVDFYRNEFSNKIYLNILIPLIKSEDIAAKIGVLVIEIDPENYLYPSINKWPVLSKTAETLLIRRDGNDVLFLNDLRFQKNTALILRSPLTNKRMPAVQAVLGYQGIFEGIDYRGVPVLSSVAAVPNSNWFIVARMDIAEVYKPLEENLLLIIILICSLLIGSGAVVGLIWKNWKLQFYREKHKSDELLIASEFSYRRLFESSTDGILILDAGTGIILDVNPFICSLLGYTQKQFIGKKLWEVGFFPDLNSSKDKLSELQREDYLPL